MANETQKQTVKLLKKNVDGLEERWPEYKREIIVLITDLLLLQRDFELNVATSIVPKIKEKIDAFAQEFDDQ